MNWPNVLKFFRHEPDFSDLQNQIAQQYSLLQSATGNDLRSKSRVVAGAIRAGVTGLEQEIQKLKEQLEKDTVELNYHELLKEWEEKKKQALQESDKILLYHLPEVFAILKKTCSLFSSQNRIMVKASEFDATLAEKREYIHIEGDTAMYSNEWVAGGKEIVWSMIPHDTQITAGIILQQGNIVEMLNGEGKTLAAVFPAFLYALGRRKIHVCTANPFLALRDCEWMRPLLEFHGISVEAIDSSQPNTWERRKAYEADVIYGSSNEFGYDYLRDNMIFSIEEKNQSELDIVIIDEIDHILLDEARTSMNISGMRSEQKFVKDEYSRLKDAAEQIIAIQHEWVETYFGRAKEFFAAGRYEDSCFYMHLVKIASPKHDEFHSYINLTPDVLRRLNKYEASLQSDAIKDAVHEHLMFYFPSAATIEFSAKGENVICTLTGEADFWKLPDLDTELALLNEQSMPAGEKMTYQKKLFDNYELTLERQKIVQLLLKASLMYANGIDYIVDNGAVVLVDEATGRPLHERLYSEGLHQAIEVKENLPITDFTEIAASITVKSFFEKYNKMSGMTATAKTDEKEYNELYKKKVIVVPPYEKPIRTDNNDLVYKTKPDKIDAVVKEVVDLQASGRPVLIGTLTVEDSEMLGKCLYNAGVKPVVLNARQDKNESLIISEAGLPGRVTIAAMMAGRGTDIKLAAESLRNGGLAVIGYERHQSRRQDLQLKGRAGRHGQPGTSQFFVSLEDDLMRMFGSERIAKVMDIAGYKPGEVIQHKMVTKSIERAQKKVEENHLFERSRLYQYDEVINNARDEIYRKRDDAITGSNVRHELMMMFDEVSKNIIASQADRDYENFAAAVTDTLNMQTRITEEEFETTDKQELQNKLTLEALDNYAYHTSQIAETAMPVISNIITTQGSHIVNVSVPFSFKKLTVQVLSNIRKAHASAGREIIRKLEGLIIATVIDKHWKIFLKQHTRIKENVSYLSRADKYDPLFIFKQDISGYYNDLLTNIHTEIVTDLCFASIPSYLKSESSTDDFLDEFGPQDTITNAYAGYELAETDSGQLTSFDSQVRINLDLCFFVRGRDSTGKNAWYFVLVDRDKKEDFLTHRPQDSYDIADYGKIVASGYGDKIPDETVQLLKETYGFEVSE